MKWDKERIFFLSRPDEPEEPCYLIFELREAWFALDGEKLILPIEAKEKNGREITHGKGLLSQYGGSELGMNMAANGSTEAGSEWMLSYSQDHGFICEPTD